MEPIGRPLEILAVDDEPLLCRMIGAMLKPAGHVVTTATSAEEATELLAARRFDLVITDVGLGEGMSGWDLADRIRVRWPATRIALATGWGAQIDDEEAHAHGVSAVLAKPYRIQELEALVARVMR